jgi:hypothetical protein
MRTGRLFFISRADARWDFVNGGRYRIRTYGFHRVKVALYR